MPLTSVPAGAGISLEDNGLLHGIFSALVDSIMVLDPDGHYLWVSRGAAESLGHSAESLRGRRWQEILTDAFTRRVLQDTWDLALERGEPVREEVAHPGPAGLRHYDLHLCPVRGKGGQVVAVVLSTRDNTHRKAVEETLRQTEEQLRHAQKMDSLGKLAGGIAHDFNNLLTVVNGYSDLLLQTLPQDPLPGQAEADSARALVEEIRKAGQKASLLTQQLLAFGRKQSSLPKPLDLNQVVRDMEKMLRRSMTHPIEMSTDLHPGLPMVVSDPGQAGQVLMNLVLNARDALPKGGRIRIRTLETRLAGDEDDLLLSPGPGLYSALRVEDDGVGIGPEIRDRLFEPFFSTKEKGKGTGLGLSTVHSIVKQAGGGISLWSRPRQGAAFTVYLPQATQPLVEVE
ncbi:MAG TPA: ATP-binding protein, partial [Fibrobacteria bacterium]|nr:ATP-binding protein [Fibrobacteria bacterium]